MKLSNETTAPTVAALAGFALAVGVCEWGVVPARTAPAEAEAARLRGELTAARAELDAHRRAAMDRERIPPQNLPLD